MAAFPTHGQRTESTVETLDDLQIDRATNGIKRGRGFYTAPMKRFRLRLEPLTSAQHDTLEAFYTTNRLLAFDMIWQKDGATYSVIFAGPIKWTCTGGKLWNAEAVVET